MTSSIIFTENQNSASNIKLYHAQIISLETSNTETIPEIFLNEDSQISKILIAPQAYFTKINIAVVSLLSVFDKPNVAINGEPIPKSNLTQNSPSTWVGYMENILYNEFLVITVNNETVLRIPVEFLEEPPTLENIELSENPNNQTTLKFDDLLTISGKLSKKGKIKLVDFGIFQESQLVDTDDLGNFTFMSEVSNRSGEHSFQIKLYSSDNVGSDIIDVDIIKILEQSGFSLINVIKINYPGVQKACKLNDTITIQTNLLNITDISEYDVEYISDSFYINDPNIYETFKTLSVIATDNQIDFSNFSIKLTKYSNQSEVILLINIPIINTTPNVILQNPRTLSSGNGELLHELIVASDVPIMIFTCQINENNISNLVIQQQDAYHYKINFNVTDTSIRGPLVIKQVEVFSNSNTHTTILNNKDSFKIGGFSKRILVLPEWPNRQAGFNVPVLNHENLRCTNLSKDNNNNYNYNFEFSLENKENTYTIIDNSGNININGGIFYNCDLHNALSNTSGIMKIEIEELV